jgi:hypothetical protein
MTVCEDQGGLFVPMIYKSAISLLGRRTLSSLKVKKWTTTRVAFRGILTNIQSGRRTTNGERRVCERGD